MKMRLTACALSAAISAAFTEPAFAQERALSDIEWREDVEQAVNAIVERHPDPFRKVEQTAFAETKANLVADIPSLSDHQIETRLAQLIAMLGDGHTRISVPRLHPEFGVEQGHVATSPPSHTSLAFASLPVRFEIFDDGVFIVGADKSAARLIGAEVTAFDETPIAEVLEAARTTIAADNEMGAKSVLPDRISLPALLHALGAIERPDGVRLALKRTDGAEEAADLEVLGDEPVVYVSAISENPPIALTRPGEKVWWTVLSGKPALFIQIKEIEAFPQTMLADTLHDAFAAAKRARADRVIIDIRENQGGTSQFNPAIIRAVLASGYNRYGHLYILIGRRTFSAAQMLLNQFEQFSEAAFVGEASGSSPTMFGDPVRIVLKNSGLTLRVSMIEWRSWLAAEFRAEIDAHLDAPYLASQFFAGKDGAMEAALRHRPERGVAGQVEALFRSGKTQGAILRFLSHLSDPALAARADPAGFVASGRALIADGLEREGHFMMVLASDYYPGSAAAQAGLGFSLERRGDAEGAQKRYKRALELDPKNAEARNGLRRLGGLVGSP